VVLGAGAIGLELAQAFARFGSTVTVVDRAPRVLPAEDPDAASIVAGQLMSEGIRLELGVRVTRAEGGGDGVRLRFERADGSEGEAGGAQLLVAAGRVPQLEGLGLEAADVAVSDRGLIVDDRLRTSNRRIFAAGDVCGSLQFTHAADAMARIAIQNALFFGRRRVSSLVVPWCTYTDPEVAQVGLTAGEARERGISVDTITVELSGLDRAIVDDEAAGFVRVHHDRGRLLGCTIVAPHAGDLIGEAALALTYRHTLADLSATIHPYPTLAEALRRAGDAHRRSRLTPRVRRLLEGYFRWTR
jgi:pyruvate/2-oxoglutarate dehydrogenase complex dihydrolipoamide dehydrogenase (E3) component